MTKSFTVKITVAEPWIEDGFRLNTKNMQDIFQTGLENALPYAYSGEIQVVVKPLKSS